MAKILTFFPFVMVRETGGDRSFIKTVKRWSLLRNQIHVVTTYTGYKLLKENQVEFIPHIFKAPQMNKGWREFFGSHYREISQFLQIPKEKFDFVYCPSEMVAYIVPAYLAKVKFRIPLVIEIKLLDDYEINFFSSFRYLAGHENRPFLRPLAVSFDTVIRNFLVKKADLVLALSDYDRRLLCRIGVVPQRIRQIKRGIDCGQIKKIKVTEKIFDGCFMGQLIPRKGIWDLVKAWKKVVDYIPSSKLAIIGDGPIEIREKLDSLIENLGLGQNIIRFGWMSNDKYVVMKQSKFFIFPSFSDAFALSVCEAMACQLPVISYDLPQFREHYGKGIIRVEKGNVEKLAQAVRMLLGNRDMLEKLGFDAFEQSKEYNLDKAAKEELQIIMEKFPV